jgi:hypothetical protein
MGVVAAEERLHSQFVPRLQVADCANPPTWRLTRSHAPGRLQFTLCDTHSLSDA